jgi:hypothetical protein
MKRVIVSLRAVVEKVGGFTLLLKLTRLLDYRSK